MNLNNYVMVTSFPNTTQAVVVEDIIPTPTKTTIEDGLPRCDELMQYPSSPLSDGAFLSRRTTQVVWKMRHDGSRELTLPLTCHLKRYTAREAGKCLQNKSILFLGDSLTRYMYLSLAYFIERKQWPKRFQATDHTPCYQFDEHNKTACSEESEPNVCCEYDFKHFKTGGWGAFVQYLGGDTDGGIFRGRMEAKSVRVEPMSSEGYQYISSKEDGRTKLTFIGEYGWNGNEPFRGWNFSGCANTGTCRYSPESYQTNIDRHNNSDFDWDYPNISTAFESNTSFRKQYQKTNFIIYNRGLWGTLPDTKAETMMEAMHDMKGGKYAISNRCFFRSTTGSDRSREKNINSHEYRTVRNIALNAGCEYFDIAHITEEFSEFVYMLKPLFSREYRHIFWDGVHYVSLRFSLMLSLLHTPYLIIALLSSYHGCMKS